MPGRSFLWCEVQSDWVIPGDLLSVSASLRPSLQTQTDWVILAISVAVELSPISVFSSLSTLRPRDENPTWEKLEGYFLLCVATS